LDWRAVQVNEPNFKGKGPYADLDRVVCNKIDHVGARAIFPLLTYSGFSTPTVKHHCPRTALAASIRSCSNFVKPQENIMNMYELWFKSYFMPDILLRMQKEQVLVEFEKWLEKDNFDAKYRDKMRKAMDPSNRTVGTPDDISVQYEAFAKIELQYTEVAHELKDTILNDVKERQICGPLDEKKIVANAFINAIEGLFHKYVDEYCGRDNWMAICKSLDKAFDIPDVIFGDGDGSAFDTTQKERQNKLMNLLLMSILDLSNVQLGPEFDKAEIASVLKRSLKLQISVDHGKLKYNADGRASGDGWTTLGNSILMLSYWKYVQYCAGIPNNRFFLKVKGDDVLFATSRKYLPALKRAIDLLMTKDKAPKEHGLGQICKRVTFGDITEVSFLSCHFFWTKDGLRMTRIPSRVLQTICYSTKFRERNGLEVAKQLRYSKGCSLNAWAADLPIFGVLARKMMELGKQGSYVDVNYYSDYGRNWTKTANDYDSYVYYLGQRYNVDALKIKEIEAAISSISEQTRSIEIPALELFFRDQLVCG